MSRSLITEERKSSALLANCQPNEGIHARADITHGSADRLCHSRPVVTFDAQRLAADLGEARLLDRRDLSRRRALNTDADRRDRSLAPTPHTKKVDASHRDGREGLRHLTGRIGNLPVER